MTNYDSDVALVDTGKYTNALAEIIQRYLEQGFGSYISTFIFRCLPDNEKTSKQIMRGEVERVFLRFLTEVHRYPRSLAHYDNNLLFIGCPDWPYPRRSGRRSCKKMSPKNGLHFAGVLLIPPFNRLKRGVKEHFEVEQRIYIRPGFPLQRIHIEHIRTTPKRAVDYTFKALKKGRVGPDDLLILPAVG